MFQKFMRICSMILVIVLLVNMLPASVLGAALRDALEADATEQLTAQQTTEQETSGEVTILGELTDKRTEYTKQYLLSDGTFMAAVYADAVHYEKNGAWEEIDNTLKSVAGAYTTTAGDWSVSFPQQLSSAKNITITKDGYTLSFGMAGRLNQSSGAVVASINAVGSTAETFAVANAQVSLAQTQQVDLSEAKAAAKFEQLVQDKLYSKLSYANVYANTDIVYDLQSNKVKESVILSQYDSTLRGYRYTLNTGGMIPVLDDTGHIEFYDPAMENIVMTMPAPFLEDANGEYNFDIQVQLTGSGSTYTLTYLLPQQWLADSTRAYPVVLDPVVSAGTGVNNIADQTVFSIGSKSYTWIVVECGYDVNMGKERFFMAFTDLPTLTSSDVIVDASVSLYKPYTSSSAFYVGVHSVASTWTSSGISWSNMPSTGENAEDFNMVTSPTWYSWDVTNLARGWYETGSNTGMMFRASDAVEAAAVNHWSQFYSSDKGSYSPTLTIEYRNTSGLEDYWDYFSASAGRAGTGYVNAASGNLVWVRDLLGFDGNRMPVSISTIYNASERTTNNFGMGYGWRTNFHQRVYASSSYYVWEDADGTKHFFAATGTTGTYKDEDGLDLTLTTTGSGDTTYCITDIYGNKSYFDASGRLKTIQNNQQTPSSITVTYDGTSNRITTITDGVGRVYKFSYNSGVTVRIGYYGTGTTELAYVRFAYTNYILEKITDTDGSYSLYTFSNKLLTSVQDPGGYKLNYTYSSGTAARVRTVTETQGSVEGSTLTISYDSKNTTATTTVINPDDEEEQLASQTLFFNDYGNTTSIYDHKGRLQYAWYSKDTADDAGRLHELRFLSELQEPVVNLFSDSSFENRTFSYSVSGSPDSHGFSYGEGYQGNYALFVDAAANSTAKVLCKTITIPADETYTFSAYVKSTAGTVSLRLAKDDVDFAESITTTNSDIGNWVRLTVSYTNTTTAAVTVTANVKLSAGAVAYIDCVQLEHSANTGPYNLLQNADFTVSGSPAASWINTGNAVRATVATSAAPQLDNNVIKMTGSPNGFPSLYQQLWQLGEAGDTFVVGGWAKGYSAPLHSGRTFGIRVSFDYTDGDSESFTVSFDPQIEGWQYTAAQITAATDYECITVELVYEFNVNEVYFDGIHLFKGQNGTYYSYYTSGDLALTEDKDGNTTSYHFNTKRELESVANSDGTGAAYTYDSYHNVLTERKTNTKTNSVVTNTYTYDAYGNVKKVVQATNASTETLETSYTYTSNGNYLITVSDKAGNTTTYRHNSETGVLRAVEYPLDAQNDPSLEYTYDSMYRTETMIQKISDSVDATITYTYDVDRLASVATGTTTYSFSYGVFNLPSQIKAGNYVLASYSYDYKNQLETLDYGNGDKVQYTYDKDGNVTRATYEDNTYIGYAYDASGAMVKVTDSATGRTASFTYDIKKRLAEQLEQGTGFNHSVRYSYNDYDQIVSVIESVGNTTLATNYTYDDEHRVSSVTAEDASQTYTYDGFSRLSQQTTKHNNATVKTDEYTYNAISQVAVHEIKRYGTTTYATYYYTYDGNGNILSINGGGHTITYEYDTAGQLIREDSTYTQKTCVWAYDGAGNILSRTEYPYTTPEATETADLSGGKVINYVYDDDTWGDLLTSYNGKTITYERTANNNTIGNMLSDGTRTYTWEHGRQLKTLSMNGKTWTYTYDVNGMRAGRSTSGASYSYVYSGSQLSYMTVDGNTLQFIYSATGAPLAVIYNDEYYYYLTNTQGDVVALLDTDLDPVVTYAYDAWGNLVDMDGSMDGTLGIHNPLRYRGYVYDDETGLYYLQSRYYNPEIGRFISADNQLKTGDTIGLNLFAYCGNNPVNRVDPTGHDWYHWLIGGLIVAGLAALTIATCGGSLWMAANAVWLVSNGIAASSAATTIAATAFLGSAMMYGTAILAASANSNSMQEFYDQGNWLTVGATLGGALWGGYNGYTISKAQTQNIATNEGPQSTALHTSGVGSPNNNINPGGSYTKLDHNGNLYSYTQFDNLGRQTMRMDFQGRPHAGVLPHIHLFTYPQRGGRGEYIFDLNWYLIN